MLNRRLIIATAAVALLLGCSPTPPEWEARTRGIAQEQLAGYPPEFVAMACEAWGTADAEYIARTIGEQLGVTDFGAPLREMPGLEPEVASVAPADVTVQDALLIIADEYLAACRDQGGTLSSV